ncbi:hypothetical protein [Pelobacter propionicus]|uniref:Conserved hypothetical membrane protein n=1 Tax=Pelobacter propionicus (strain DSM 2379 / NBRC 103807 / OttBd1) TaxID=338966 RepID=A1AKM4_PELPD|nr:hypothetical protein [Pelobacter propionicus]ABK97894.1 conserved hypothetical membrane protein [Pelobacter propionicus DSM 2379]
MHKRKLLLMTIVAIIVTLAASHAMALVAPAAGSFGFEAYDFFINKILKGPFGAIAGILAIITGVVVMIQQKMVPAVLCILGGVLVINSDKIVTSLGMII